MLDTLFMQVVDMTKTGSVVILSVLLVRLALKRAPKIFSYVLWAAVLLRLLCPVSIESNVSLFAAFDAPAEQNETLHTETAAKQDAPIIAPPAAPGDAAHGVQTQNTAPSAAPAKMQAEADAAAWVWLGGVLAMAVYGGASYLRLRRRLLTALPLQENIYLADHIPTPFVMGLLRPKIYLPSELGEGEYKYILLHERHHIRRGDHIIKMLAFVALALHWFNPLAWVAFVCAARDMEMSCDEAVVKKLGGGVLPDYAASLLHLATGRRVIALAPLAFGEGDTKERVRNLARWKKPALWVVLLCAALCTVLTACLATNPTDKKAAEGAQDGYYLLIGADGVMSVEVSMPDAGGGVVNADGTAFEKGDKIWLEMLQGISDLRGLCIAAYSADGEIIYSLSIPENAASGEVVNIVAADEWILVPTDFVPPEDTPSDETAENTAEETGGDASPGTLISYADVDHDRINEEVYVRTIEPNMIYELTVVEEGEVLYSAQAGLAHAGWNTVMLYYEDGKDYLVEYQPSMFQGDGVYHYVIFSLDGGERVVKEESSVDFSLPLEKRSDMDAFARRMNILLRNSSVLLSTEQGILVDDWAEASSLPQIYPVRFDPDDIQTAINGERGGEITANAARLPTAPLLLQFLSGAGGWATLLTMQPDGSFTGIYSDADMGSGAAEYPNGTYYVSGFSGRFGSFERISDTMWTIKLAELQTEKQPGETWVEDGTLYIAAEAYGIAGGEEFLLCGPLTSIDDLPAECRSWHPEAYLWRQGERELLQGWAICNLNTGTAFFSEGIFS